MSVKNIPSISVSSTSTGLRKTSAVQRLTNTAHSITSETDFLTI